jgi:hypothetical protein
VDDGEDGSWPVARVEGLARAAVANRSGFRQLSTADQEQLVEALAAKLLRKWPGLAHMSAEELEKYVSVMGRNALIDVQRKNRLRSTQPIEAEGRPELSSDEPKEIAVDDREVVRQVCVLLRRWMDRDEHDRIKITAFWLYWVGDRNEYGEHEPKKTEEIAELLNYGSDSINRFVTEVAVRLANELGFPPPPPRKRGPKGPRGPRHGGS